MLQVSPRCHEPAHFACTATLLQADAGVCSARCSRRWNTRKARSVDLHWHWKRLCRAASQPDSLLTVCTKGCSHTKRAVHRVLLVTRLPLLQHPGLIGLLCHCLKPAATTLLHCKCSLLPVRGRVHDLKWCSLFWTCSCFALQSNGAERLGAASGNTHLLLVKLQHKNG
jgi:hypothetical protein